MPNQKKRRAVARLLVVDDEPRIRSYLNRSLSAQGHTVDEATDGQAALAQLDTHDIDLVLLDLVMPRSGGLDLLKVLKPRESSPPVIVLSAVTDISARVQALDLGAVDVVSKPFSSAELSARIRRHLYHKAPPPPGEQRYLEVGGVQLDLHRRRAVSAHGAVSLTTREFALLAHLMRRSNNVCSREELLHDIWDLDFDPGSNVVDACVRRLRAKLQPNPPIETVRGGGYCFYDD
jgi:DNA-binding response OmpR family regulator